MLDLVGTQWRENWVYGLGGSAVAVVCLGVGHMVYVVDCVADLWELLGPLATAGR